MPGTNITMRASFTGGNENGIAQIDVPVSGNITGVLWNISADIDADQDVAEVQLSFGSSGVSTNDSRQVISGIRIEGIQITAASAIRGDGQVMHVMNLPVSMGERIFMHSMSTAAVPGTAIATISFDFDLDRPLARRR